MKPTGSTAPPETPVQNGELDNLRLTRAVKMAVERYDPDQVILFGSAARGEMSEHSDIDLIVIKESPSPQNECSRERLDCHGDRLDIVTMNRAAAERHRLTAATLQHEALEQGKTVHLRRGGGEPVPVGPSAFTDPSGMTRTTRLRPDEAEALLGIAEEHWTTSNITAIPDRIRCCHRQQTAEHCLKALITAQGREFTHTHDLTALHSAAQNDGKHVPIKGDKKLPGRLTAYARHRRYTVSPTGVDRQMLIQSNAPVGGLLEFTRETVPKWTRETNRMLAATPNVSLEPPSADFLAGKPIDHSEDAKGGTRPTTARPGTQNMARDKGKNIKR